jgi:hypothetical protein
MEMIDHDHEDQDKNWKFTMGDQPTESVEGASAGFNEAQSVYQREIQNLELMIKRLKTEQEKITSHPLSDAQSSEIASAIDSGAYVSKEVELGVQIRDLETALMSAKKKFQFLFGDE